MEYFIKLKSDCDCLIVIDGFVKKMLKKNSFLQFYAKLENGENFIINVEPLEKTNDLRFPYKIFVENNNNTLTFSSNNIDVMHYENKYIIKLKSLVIGKNFQVLSSTNSYSVFNTFVTNITTKNTTYSLPELFNLLETKKIGANTVLCFEKVNKSGKKENFFDLSKNFISNSSLEQNILNASNNIIEEEKFVVVFYSDEIIFKDYFVNINLDSKIEILSALNDIAKHAIFTKIENKIVTQKTVYLKNEPKLTKSTNIIPLAFLQALKINNIKLCKYYLNENLKEMASLEVLKNYFGDYKKTEFDNNRYILFYNDMSYKIFEYEIENGKISKIDLK